MTNKLRLSFWLALLLSGLLIPLLPLHSQPLDMELFQGMKPRNIGPAGMSGRVTAIDGLATNPDLLVIGTAAGGAWRSESGGLSWTPIFENEKAASVGAIAINQRNPNDIWVGTGEGNPRNSVTSGYGAWRSIDGGHSWTHLGLEATRNIHRLVLNPDNPDVAWVGAIGDPWAEHPERGVFKTTDGGKTWRKVLFVDNQTGCADLVIDPTNPNKLIAAMWQHRRRPWRFDSGGPGSGLYISFDGGETWQRRTDADGLPAGNLGRIGLAIAPSQPSRVYALVEAKKNGLYRSDDGGFSWDLAADKGIGGRPFYYADIFVDPRNENRVYNLHTYVDVSQDGGKSFSRFIDPDLIHVDNHAFWVNPQDPQFIVCGNDGGLCLSRDGGRTWDFAENLPLGQFYHIRIDEATPYNVYGGLQDNGSWRGPSQVWRRKGIRNLYWNRIGGGDGFDAVPDPLDPRYGYSLSQGGNLSRYDLETGATFGIEPFLENGEALRFNWNTAIAIDPFDKKTIYLGSQYLLKSDDYGYSWQKISPDLTTNDAEKQDPHTGGLTLDNTGAETFTTIITIAPSPVTEGVLWAGTDDGHLQVTRDGGQNWGNVSANLPGLPPGSWVAQIQASAYDAAEAFAVINNYRRGDWSPYLYHTTDFGKSWQRMATADQVWGYCLSVVQDPEAPNLLFLGTEFGLYVTVDGGRHWTKWTSGYPTISTMDMAIHPREHDLVIGTFGRSVWILDDIRPLRELAKQGAAKIWEHPLKIFPAPNAYLAHLGEPNGYRSTGNGLYVGENREPGALISYYVKNLPEEEEGKQPKAMVTIFDKTGQKIRTLTHEPKKGINRFAWNLDVKGERFPNSSPPKKDAPEPGGRHVVPGDYLVKIELAGHADSTVVTVLTDPLLPLTAAEMVEKAELMDRHSANVARVTTATDRLRSANESLTTLQKLLRENAEKEITKPILAESDSLKAHLDKLTGLVNPNEDIQGIFRDPFLLGNLLRQTDRALDDTLFPATPSQRYRVDYCERQMQPILEQIDAFFQNEWTAFRKMIDRAGLTLIP